MSDYNWKMFELIQRNFPLYCITCGKYKNKHVCGPKMTQNKKLFSLLSSDFTNTISSNNMNFLRSNEKITTNLINLISPRFPKARVYPFGSREIGTGTQKSDLDVYVDIDESYHIHGLEKSVMESVIEVEKILKKNSAVWGNINITEAKVPIIETFNKIEKINCDISFSDGLAHSNTQLIKKLCDTLPIFRDMIIFLGQWLDAIELSDHINKYTLRLLIMNYLQCVRLLPSIKAMQDGISHPAKIGEWNVDYVEKKMIMKKRKPNNLKHHIKGFFKQHGKAERFNGIISTYVAATLKYDQLSEKNFINYKKFIDKYKDEEYEFSEMNVQGPFNLADNPAKRVTKEHLEKFINFSRISYAFLTRN